MGGSGRGRGKSPPAGDELDVPSDDAPRKARRASPEETSKGPAPTIVIVPILTSTRISASATAAGGGPFQAPAPPKPHRSNEERRAEAVGLAEAIDIKVVASRIVMLAERRPATLLGSGKVDEIKDLIAKLDAELVIIDHALSPIQQRNLEKAWQVKVLDRTGLILEIFGARARTREGRLQVELAHLTYQKSRLVRSWTHLERQRGGAGFLGGPGESQLELDRRLIQDRIDAIKKELAQVVKTRELHREGRRRVPYPIVAIVGYTNAGKSTLFNRLTGAEVLAKDQLFATLDPTLREVRLPSGRRVILSDTVGFISELPTMLVAAFRATLEEVIEADLILHVRDIAHGETAAQRADVEAVLKDLGRDPAAAETNALEVWNKIDLLSGDRRIETENAAVRLQPEPALVSAVSGEGLDKLLAAIDGRFTGRDEELTLDVPVTQGALLAWLHQNTQVLDKTVGPEGDTRVLVRVETARKGRLLARLAQSRVTKVVPDRGG